MLIWKRLGILAAIIPAGFAVLFQLTIAKNSLWLGAGYLLGGITIWFLGNYLNQDASKTVIEKNSGREISMNNEHSLFWIKMESWSVVWLSLGVMLILSHFTNGITNSFTFPMVLLCTLSVFLFKFYFNREQTVHQ